MEGLKGKRVVTVAVGALHSLAVTDKGEVWAWGGTYMLNFKKNLFTLIGLRDLIFLDSDQGQQGNGTTTVNKRPTLVHGLEHVKIAKVACGSSHSAAWTSPEVSSQRVSDTVLFSVARDPLGAFSKPNL